MGEGLSAFIRVKPAPVCPKCGSVMVLRKPNKTKHPEAKWAPFWGCPQFPTCDGTAKTVTKLEDQPSFWEEKDVVYERI